MKIRADFVTNSSSSSYVAIDIKSPLFAQLLEDYFDELREAGRLSEDIECVCLPYEVKGDRIILDQDESADIRDTPKSLGELFPTLVDAAKEEWSNCEQPRDLFDEFARIVKDNEAALEDSVESVSWEYVDQGWGGDHEGRFWHSYSDEEENEIKDAIVEEKNAKSEWEGTGKTFTRADVTEEEVRDYIAQSTSVETATFVYKKGKGPGTYKYEYCLEQ